MTHLSPLSGQLKFDANCINNSPLSRLSIGKQSRALIFSLSFIACIMAHEYTRFYNSEYKYETAFFCGLILSVHDIFFIHDCQITRITVLVMSSVKALIQLLGKLMSSWRYGNGKSVNKRAAIKYEEGLVLLGPLHVTINNKCRINSRMHTSISHPQKEF